MSPKLLPVEPDAVDDRSADADPDRERGEVAQLVEQTVAETARATTLQNAGMNPF